MRWSVARISRRICSCSATAEAASAACWRASSFAARAASLAYAPHVAQLVTAQRGSRIDGRTTRHPGYAESQRRRKLVEESFGWGKVVGLLRKLRHRGVALVDAVFTFTMGIYNLVRIRTLTRAGVCT